MKVWIAVYSDYDSHDVVIFTTKEKAIDFLKTLGEIEYEYKDSYDRDTYTVGGKYRQDWYVCEYELDSGDYA